MPPNKTTKPLTLSEYQAPLNQPAAGNSEVDTFAADKRLLADLLELDVSEIDTRRRPGAFANGGKNTPFDKSGFAASPTTLEANADPRNLFGSRDPHYPIQHERLQHRNVIFLKAEGLKNKEIAERLGMSAVAVSNVLRQPWAQSRVLEIIHENGGDAVRKLLQDEALRSVERLIVERDNSTARPSERIAAADKLLDRLYGKPNQPIEHRSQNLDQMSDEELERIAAGGDTPTSSSTITRTS